MSGTVNLHKVRDCDGCKERSVICMEYCIAPSSGHYLFCRACANEILKLADDQAIRLEVMPGQALLELN